jgi:hypothetical protein
MKNRDEDILNYFRQRLDLRVKKIRMFPEVTLDCQLKRRVGGYATFVRTSLT